ncbi:MAG: histidinol-phosphate transaminase [Terriglobales bacterium]
MSRFDEVVPPFVRRLGPYVPGKPVKQAEQESGVRCIKMASNENPFGPSPAALAALRDAAAESNFYPDADNTELRRLLAARNGVKPEELLITCGSSSMLNIIARTLLAPGLNAITSERSFIVYPIAVRSTGAEFVTVPMRDNSFDLDAILAAVTPETRAIFIANPNNPTGTLIDVAEMDRFLDRVPQNVCVVLDEAYAEFAEYFAAERGMRYTRSMEYVREGRNVVVLRTFSKAQGLAGLRIGYGVAPAGLMQYFTRMKTVFTVSGVAEAAAIAALSDAGHIRRTQENNASSAQWLIEHIRELGIKVAPTWANFLYIELGEDASAVSKRLQNEGVIIRPLTGSWGAPTAIRVTIGTPEQNQVFFKAFKKVMEREPVNS